jgi:hypothetical protein
VSPQAHQYLCHLFELFDVVNLGEGDLTAGANTHAALALAIAGSQRPDFALCGANGSRTSIGGSFLVSGALSAGLVAEHLIVPLANLGMRLPPPLRRGRGAAVACCQAAPRRLTAPERTATGKLSKPETANPPQLTMHGDMC